MFWIGLAGFIGGMLCGAIVNRILLRRVPREKWRHDKSLKLRYGALNWLFGIIGLVAACYLHRLPV